ncbi:metallophosphoesterase family protein [Persephonella sp.]
MRTAYISDLHGNIHAVESLEKDLKTQGVERVVCLGDILNFGANPKEVLEWVKENCSLILRGEHDTFVSQCEDVFITNPDAIKVADWTYDQIDDDDREYISKLPKDAEWENIIITHDEPSVPGSMYFVTSLKDAKDTFSCYTEQICFYGHTHIPLIFEKSTESIKLIRDIEEYVLEENKQYLISVGSIGQPRDKDPRLSYIIHDEVEKKILVRRVEYDCDKAAQEILKKGLPPIFAASITGKI